SRSALYSTYPPTLHIYPPSLHDALPIYAPNVLFGVIIGAAVVLLFAGLAINAVSRAAGAVVYEVRRQFKDKPGIMDGSQRPEYRSEEHTSELQSREKLVCRLLLGTKQNK